MQPSQVKPWYKQFWPWFLIAIPSSSIIVAFFVVHFATNTTDSLVVDDYYKEGRTINNRLTKEKRAEQLRIASDLTVEDGSIALKFHSGIPQNGNALQLRFFHVTLDQRDVTLLLTRDASGVYRAFTEADLSGKWHVTLMPLDEEWKIQRTLTFPRTGAIPFNP